MQHRSILIIVIAAVIPLSGCQKPCKMAVNDAPALRGFRLGIKTEEVQRRFPPMPAIQMDDLGMNKITIGFDAIAENVRTLHGSAFIVSRVNFPEFSDVWIVEISFIDHRAYEITVFYSNRNLWQSEEQFRQHLTTTLNLPSQWEELKFTKNYKSMSCGAVGIDAGFMAPDPLKGHDPYPFVRIVDFAAIVETSARQYRKTQQEEQRLKDKQKAFRP